MSEEKKIIIDEDWKAQVEAEKKAAAKQSAPAPADGGGAAEETPPTDVGGSPATGGSPADGASAEGAAQGDDPPMPPASIGMLMSSLATEALLSMGQFPHPATGEVTVRRNQAKYLIDLLDVLKQKTAGNLTSDEAIALDDILHQLRMAFVATK